MTTCPVCRQSVDPKGRVAHKCAPAVDLPPPPRPEQSGFVPPPQGSKWPVFAVLGVVLLSLVAGVLMLLTGGEAEPVAVDSSTTEAAASTTVVETTVVPETVGPTTLALDTVPPTVAPETTAAPPPVDQTIESTKCLGSTDTGSVPIAFMTSLLELGVPTYCRFAGRWIFATWPSADAVALESGVFNIDQRADRAFVFPIPAPVPASCVLERVGDPAIAAELSIGLPTGACAAG